MLCYRCGSHVPDSSESCGTCGQKLSDGEVRQATGTFSHKRAGQSSIAGSPYKAGETIAGRYLVKEVIGTGPLGFVLRAQDKDAGVEVAVKVIHPRFLQTPDERNRFAQQIAAVRAIGHPNLVQIYGDGEDQGWPFYAMQLVEGLTLRKIVNLHVEKQQAFSPREVEPILAQIATGLEAGASIGPHGDLRPENVVILPDLLKLSDFALSLTLPRLLLIQALKTRNADRYLAPEFVAGGEVDARCDVYALGVIIGEMLGGQASNEPVDLAKHNPAVPPRLEGLYRKALSPAPEARFSSTRELIQEFSAIVHAATPLPRAARSPTPKPIAATQIAGDQAAGSGASSASGWTVDAARSAQSAGAGQPADAHDSTDVPASKATHPGPAAAGSTSGQHGSAQPQASGASTSGYERGSAAAQSTSASPQPDSARASVSAHASGAAHATASTDSSGAARGSRSTTGPHASSSTDASGASHGSVSAQAGAANASSMHASGASHGPVSARPARRAG